MLRRFSALCLVSLVAACGGHATFDGEGAGGSAAAAGSGAAGTGGTGAGASGGSGGSAGSAGNAGAGGSAGAAGAPAECVVQPEEPGFEQPTCEDLDVLTVSGLVLEGAFIPGAAATVRVNLNEVAGHGFNYYPGVKFKSDHPGVTVSEDNWFYAVLACESYEMTGSVTVADSVAPGTKVTITAQVAMLNSDCPKAHQIALLQTVTAP